MNVVPTSGSYWRHKREPNRIAIVSDYEEPPGRHGIVRFVDHVNGCKFSSTYSLNDFRRAYNPVNGESDIGLAHLQLQ